VERSCGHGNDPSDPKNAGKFLSGCSIGSFSRRAQVHDGGGDGDDDEEEDDALYTNYRTVSLILRYLRSAHLQRCFRQSSIFNNRLCIHSVSW
jgi:hypothetical protein